MVNADVVDAIGGEIFNLITSGMYNTPLAVYREYIQNAADSIFASSKPTNGRIEIDIDPLQRRVKILDNGLGLSPSAARRELVAVAQSRKQRGNDRGFRGIGRLSGLAFAEKVVFRTRCAASNPITEISWSSEALRQMVSQRATVNQFLEGCVEIIEIEGVDGPDHFFEVEICGVARHASGNILNSDAVRQYVSEVCPVPYNSDFQFANSVRDLFVDDPKALLNIHVFVNNQEEPVTRPFGSSLVISENVQDPFVGLDSFRVPSVDGIGSAAIGWLVHTEYFGVIPKSLGVRGIRVREGNLQIGDESVFDHLFSEERFNRWCVGEVHVVDTRIVPNGRRDYFEPSPHTRNLENHIGAIAKKISARCRSASATRNKLRKTSAELQQLEATLVLASSGYLRASDAREIVQKASQRLGEISDTARDFYELSAEDKRRLKILEHGFADFRPRRGRPPLGRVSGSDVGTYRRVFRTLVDSLPTPEIALRTIEAVLQRENDQEGSTNKLGNT